MLSEESGEALRYTRDHVLRVAAAVGQPLQCDDLAAQIEETAGSPPPG
jgi:hypothetical protein